MRTNNGYAHINETSGDVVLTVTELDGQIPSGSRTAVVLMDLPMLGEHIRQCEAIANKLRLESGKCRAPFDRPAIKCPIPSCEICHPKSWPTDKQRELQAGECPGITPQSMEDPLVFTDAAGFSR